MTTNIPPAPLGSLLYDSDGPPIVDVECYLDLICPYSAKMFMTLFFRVLDERSIHPKLVGKIRVRFHHVIQPWHPQSTLVHEVALATRKVVCDEEDYRMMISDIFEEFLENGKFKDEDTWNKTRGEIYEDVVRTCGQKQILTEEKCQEVLALLNADGQGVVGNSGNAVTQDLKWACRHHRTRGVHVTPTVFVNGVEATQVSSGWNRDQWNNFLGEFMPDE